ncbi:MAG: hypothetical protein HYZ77_02110, partial [Serratia liquefaciens]|nr:hypothetical protein [Serratia liquefaciens]
MTQIAFIDDTAPVAGNKLAALLDKGFRPPAESSGGWTGSSISTSSSAERTPPPLTAR